MNHFFCLLLITMGGVNCFLIEQQATLGLEENQLRFNKNCDFNGHNHNDNDMEIQKLAEFCFEVSSEANAFSYADSFFHQGPNKDWLMVCTRNKFHSTTFAAVGIRTNPKPNFPKIYSHLDVGRRNSYYKVKMLVNPEPLDFCLEVQERYVKLKVMPKYSEEPRPEYEFLIETPSKELAQSYILQGPIYNFNETAFNFEFKLP